MNFITYQQYMQQIKNNPLHAGLSDVKANYNIEPYDNEEIQKIDKKHDKIIKKILSRKKEVAKFINEFLNIKQKITQEEIEQCNSDFITNQYLYRQSDIIYKIKNKPIYFLIEHQSTVDENMILRISEYIGEIMKKEIRNQIHTLNKIREYPIVVPVVIYTGYRKWNAKTKFSEKQYRAKGFEEYKNHLKYNLIAVQDYTFEELLEKKSLFASVMIIEKCKTEEELIEQLEKIVEIIEEPEEKELLSEIITHILSIEIPKDKTEEILKKLNSKEEKGMSPLTKMLLDIEIKGKKKGEIEGRKKGEIEGRKKGEIEGRKKGEIEGKKTGIMSVVKK